MPIPRSLPISDCRVLKSWKTAELGTLLFVEARRGGGALQMIGMRCRSIGVPEEDCFVWVDRDDAGRISLADALQEKPALATSAIELRLDGPRAIQTSELTRGQVYVVRSNPSALLLCCAFGELEIVALACIRGGGDRLVGQVVIPQLTLDPSEYTYVGGLSCARLPRWKV